MNRGEVSADSFADIHNIHPKQESERQANTNFFKYLLYISYNKKGSGFRSPLHLPPPYAPYGGVPSLPWSPFSSIHYIRFQYVFKASSKKIFSQMSFNYGRHTISTDLNSVEIYWNRIYLGGR